MVWLDIYDHTTNLDKLDFSKKYKETETGDEINNLGLSINESQEVRELVKHSRHSFLIYDNLLGFYMFELYDDTPREKFYVIYDAKYNSYYYYIWNLYRSSVSILDVVENHRSLRKKRL